MKVVAAFLADAANVRENTLNVLSGFINTLNREEFPAPMGCVFVVCIEYDEIEARRGVTDHQFRIECEDAVTGETIFGLNGGFTLRPAGDSIGTLPLLFNIADATVRTPGSYRMVFTSEGLAHTIVRFYVNPISLPSLDGENDDLLDDPQTLGEN